MRKSRQGPWSQGCLDWPLSREEKKTRLLQLYDQDVATADKLLRSYEGDAECNRIESGATRGSPPDLTARRVARHSTPGKFAQLHLETGECVDDASGGEQPCTPEAVLPSMPPLPPPPALPSPPSPDPAGSQCDAALSPSPRTPQRADAGTPDPQYSARTEFVSARSSFTPQASHRQASGYGASHSRGQRRVSRAAAAAAFQAFAPAGGVEAADKAAVCPIPRAPETLPPLKAALDYRSVFSAARHGKHKEVEAALTAGFSASSTDMHGNTLFHVACQNGHKRVAKTAIRYGGDMDAQNSRGNTGIHFLYAFGYAELAEYFIAKGASSTIRNEARKLPCEGIR
eukprot:TRINITY_DN92127_c0_g1_i1.p1 TRINITY_DN92127_c0_g1~~TRINITY_DN92127_c0_g1_i1.p1  ORF type:complete len:343 (+),score=36.94 TRINITY_DN92127_c0_g1_i1:64-1092(+)